MDFEKYLRLVFEKIGNEIWTADCIADKMNADNERVPFVEYSTLKAILENTYEDLRIDELQKQEQEKHTKPYKKFLFIEDGSVDIDSVCDELNLRNPEIKVIVYRQGSNKPEFMEIAKGDK